MPAGFYLPWINNGNNGGYWNNQCGNNNNNGNNNQQTFNPCSGNTSWMTNNFQTLPGLWQMAQSLDPTGGSLSNQIGQIFYADAMEKQMRQGGNYPGQCVCGANNNNAYLNYFNQVQQMGQALGLSNGNMQYIMNALAQQAGGNYNPYANYTQSTNGYNDVMSQYMMLALLMSMLESSIGDLENLDSMSEEELAKRLGINDNNVGSVKLGMENFGKMDKDSNTSLSWDEYLDFYISEREKELGKALSKNSPQYASYAQEAKNMFDAIAVDGVIPKARFEQMLKLCDIKDGKEDGRIKGNFMSQMINKIKGEGSKTPISSGKTLGELLNEMG